MSEENGGRTLLMWIVVALLVIIIIMSTALVQITVLDPTPLETIVLQVNLT